MWKPSEQVHHIYKWMSMYGYSNTYLRQFSINFFSAELEASVRFVICLLEKNISVVKGDMSIDKAQHNFGFQAEVRLNCFGWKDRTEKVTCTLHYTLIIPGSIFFLNVKLEEEEWSITWTGNQSFNQRRVLGKCWQWNEKLVSSKNYEFSYKLSRFRIKLLAHK